MFDTTATSLPVAGTDTLTDVPAEASTEREKPLDAASETGENQTNPETLRENDLAAYERLKDYLQTPIAAKRNGNLQFMNRNFNQRETAIDELAIRLKDRNQMESKDGKVDANNWFELSEQLHWLLVEESLALMVDIRDDLQDFSNHVATWNESVRQGKVDKSQLDTMQPLAHDLHAFASTFDLFLSQVVHGVHVFSELGVDMAANPVAAQNQNEVSPTLNVHFESGMHLLLDEYNRESGVPVDSQQQVSQIEGTFARLVEEVQRQTEVFLELETKIEAVRQELAKMTTSSTPEPTAPDSSATGTQDISTSEATATVTVADATAAAPNDGIVTRLASLAGLFISPLKVHTTSFDGEKTADPADQATPAKETPPATVE